MLTPEEWEVVVLSLRVALVAMAMSFPAALALAYGLARRKMPAPFLVENLVLLPVVVPPVVTGFLLLWLLGPAGPVGGWLSRTFGVQVAFSEMGAALAAAVVAFPLLVQPMRVAFEQVDPAWEEAAQVYGGTRWNVLRYVTLPLAARGIAAGLILGFARALGEFGATIVLAGNIPGRSRTIPLAIFSEVNRLGGEVRALRLVVLAVLLSLMSLLLHAWLTRRLHHPHDGQV